jgi:hypothetical protein
MTSELDNVTFWGFKISVCVCVFVCVCVCVCELIKGLAKVEINGICCPCEVTERVTELK